MERIMKLSASNVLLVKGPASVKCIGSVSVLGIDACTKEVTLRAGKILPFEASRRSEVKIRLGSGGNYSVVGESKVGVSIWKEVANRITLRNKPTRIMIVGATDTGKSTLATYLSNITSANKMKVSIVDGDVGQSDLAPPGCIGASMIKEEFLDLRDISAEYSSFIGAISPRGIEKLVIISIKNMADRLSAKSDICIINTDGYIDKRGIDYKIELAKALKTDLLVYIGNLASRKLLDEFKSRFLHVVAPERVSKTHYEREERRLGQYYKFVGEGSEITFEVKNKKFGFMGKIYDNIILARFLIHLKSITFPIRFLKGMFVGLSARNEVKGFAIVTKVGSNKITLKTQYEGEFDTIILSTIRLSPDMRREYQLPLVVNWNNWSKASAISKGYYPSG
ncbi:MAG: Clp1/GlmU family protein [Nitrososphaerales archaeon]